MIYNNNYRDFQVGIFAIDIDEKFFSYFPKKWQHAKAAESWLRHNEHRIYLRLWTFIDSVLERHNNGKMGFRDPIIVWSNIETKEFNIHPGANRILLKMLLPEVRQVGWVIDSTCASRDQYKGIFNNIKEIQRDNQGNNLILWNAHHRTGRGGTDQYDFSLVSDKYLGNSTYDTHERRDRWLKIRRRKGFACYVNDKFIYNIGEPKFDDKYNITTPMGIYQLFLHYFFGYSLDRWKTKYFRRKL